jgi:phosphoglycerate kinase
MRPFPTLEHVDFANKSVFCRLDLNVPLQAGRIVSDARIVAALPTLRHILDQGAKLAIASHLGRPKNARQRDLSLEPVGVRLSELLKRDVLMSAECTGDGVRGLLRDLRPGGLLLLENLRFHSGEEKNDPEFSRQLSQGFDTYVNDAFGASHRAHASIVGMVKHFREAAAGLLLAREVEALGALLQAPKKPFVALVGGAKVSDKVGVLEALLSKVDVLCIGGAMAYTFLRAQDISVGCSRVEDDKVRVAAEVLKKARAYNVTVVLPTDHVAARTFAADAAPVKVAAPALSAELMGLDIGAKTAAAMVQHIATAATVFWNGPMGVCEWPAFAHGTQAIAQAVASCSGHTVVGGGDSVAALEQAGLVSEIDHVSTGGGASLELLQFGSLPGLDALSDRLRDGVRNAQREAERAAMRQAASEDDANR